MDGAVLASKPNRSGIRLHRPLGTLTQGALASSVRAHQRMDFARPDAQGSVAQRRDGAVPLLNACRLEQELRHRHHSRSVWVGSGGTGVAPVPPRSGQAPTSSQAMMSSFA